MNKKIFDQYMRTKPETKDKKYIFLVDNGGRSRLCQL